MITNSLTVICVGEKKPSKHNRSPEPSKRFGGRIQIPGRKSKIPITFGPIHAAFEPYFAASLPIVVHVNLLNLHNEKRTASRRETRLNSTECMWNTYATKHTKATLSNLP